MPTGYASLYIAGWATACLVALWLFLRSPHAYALVRRAYWAFLIRPWKVITFLCAAAGITGVAPYTGDPTWDHVDALFMSALAFLTAPWVVGAIYRVVTGHLPFSQAYVASCLWLFSASWSYDLYLLGRDGSYPVTWLANLFASSVLYLCAGLFWSLDWRPERGMVFAFTESDWPRALSGPVFWRVLLPSLSFMGLVGGMILYLLWGAR